MKFETLQKPIKTETIEQHEKELQDRIIEIQLGYVDKLFSKQIPPLCETSKIDDIHYLIEEYTDLPIKIMKHRCEDNKEKELFLLKERLLNDISNLYKSDHEHWIERTEELLEKELKKYKEFKKSKSKKDNDIEDRIGLIDFGMDSNLGNILPGSGISDEDICMQIHFEDFFKQQNSDVKNLFSSNSLEKLALEIVEKHPETKAVVGKSWLMDTAIAKRIGFKVYNRNFDIKENIGSFWGQFVDSNGQIKNNDVLKFLETGEPHYKIAAGAIMVEDFLGKYLPEERKGRISLKEQTEESREFIKDYNRITKAIEKWDEISFDELFVVLNSSISFSNYFKTPNGIEYINFFRKAKELNLKRKEVKYLDYKNKQKIRDDFTLFLKENENKFIEREVII